MRSDDIKTLIAAGLPRAQIHVASDDDTHFEAVVVSDDFAGKGRVQRHQLVYRALGDSMGTAIHALSLRTLTPEEWQELQA